MHSLSSLLEKAGVLVDDDITILIRLLPLQAAIYWITLVTTIEQSRSINFDTSLGVGCNIHQTGLAFCCEAAKALVSTADLMSHCSAGIHDVMINCFIHSGLNIINQQEADHFWENIP